jgi:hypothetical protein
LSSATRCGCCGGKNSDRVIALDKSVAHHKINHVAKEAIDILEAIAILLCPVALFGIVFLGFMALMKLSTGWGAVARQFPARDFHKLGARYPRQSVFFNGRFRAGKMFCVEPAEEGLLVTPMFARRAPALIRWLDIKNVETGDILSVNVDCANDRKMSLDIPADALPLLREKISADRFTKHPSLSEIIGERFLRPPEN